MEMNLSFIITLLLAICAYQVSSEDVNSDTPPLNKIKRELVPDIKPEVIEPSPEASSMATNVVKKKRRRKISEASPKDDVIEKRASDGSSLINALVPDDIGKNEIKRDAVSEPLTAANIVESSGEPSKTEVKRDASTELQNVPLSSQSPPEMNKLIEKIYAEEQDMKRLMEVIVREEIQMEKMLEKITKLEARVEAQTSGRKHHGHHSRHHDRGMK